MKVTFFGTTTLLFDDGKDQMPCSVTELAKRRQLRIIAPYQTVEFKPSKLHREQKLEQGRKEECRKRDSRKRNDGDGIVRLAVLLRCSDHTQRDRDQKFQHEGNCSHDK